MRPDVIERVITFGTPLWGPRHTTTSMARVRPARRVRATHPDPEPAADPAARHRDLQPQRRCRALEGVRRPRPEHGQHRGVEQPHRARHRPRRVVHRGLHARRSGLTLRADRRADHQTRSQLRREERRLRRHQQTFASGALDLRRRSPDGSGSPRRRHPNGRRRRRGRRRAGTRPSGRRPSSVSSSQSPSRARSVVERRRPAGSATRRCRRRRRGRARRVPPSSRASRDRPHRPAIARSARRAQRRGRPGLTPSYRRWIASTLS